MKKYLALVGTFILGAALLLAGCGSDTKTASTSGQTVLKVGASPVPHAEILEHVKPLLAKEGIDLKIVEFTDYNTPNLSLADKELDANFFQHVPYMNEFAKAHNLKLVSAGSVHVEPMGVYSKKIKSLSELKDGDKIAIPNDQTNGGRALILLDKLGLIKLKDPANILSTVNDIVENSHNYQFIELEAAQLPRSFDDITVSVINTNYALEAGLNPTADSLALESKDSPYVNILTVRAGEENNPAIKKLVAALQSEDTKKFIEEKYKGAILPAF